MGSSQVEGRCRKSIPEPIAEPVANMTGFSFMQLLNLVTSARDPFTFKYIPEKKITPANNSRCEYLTTYPSY
jgi:hypothetical protein